MFLEVEDGIIDQLCVAGCNQDLVRKMFVVLIEIDVDVDCDYDRCPHLVSFDEAAGVGQQLLESQGSQGLA